MTDKQRQIYEFVRFYTDRNGYSPSLREIGRGVGLKSVSSVHFHVKKMVDMGVLTQSDDGVLKSRSVRTVTESKTRKPTSLGVGGCQA